MSINRNKYMPYIFNNGRVVLVEQKTIDEAIDFGKEILIICNAWSGGYAYAIGASKRNDPDFGECWDMYGYDIKDEELDATDLDKFYRVIISSGERIQMESGRQANYHNNLFFADYDSSEEEIKEKIKDKTNITQDEILTLRFTVDFCNTVNFLNYKHIKDGKPDYTDWEERIWALINIGILPKDSVKYMATKRETR